MDPIFILDKFTKEWFQKMTLLSINWVMHQDELYVSNSISTIIFLSEKILVRELETHLNVNCVCDCLRPGVQDKITTMTTSH